MARSDRRHWPRDGAPRDRATMIYLTAEQRAKLEAIAQQEGYGLSSMGALLIEEAMATRESLTQR